MRDVLRMTPHEFWWRRPHDPAAELGFVKLTCDAPAADPWEVKFPRYWVEYGGWCGAHNMRLAVMDIAERDVAEQIRDHLSVHERPGYGNFWAEVKDLGRARFEEFDDDARFWATGGTRSGQRGRVVIRNRDRVAVQWDGEHFVGGNSFPMDLMSTTQPEQRAVPYGMGWLKG
jgi:hypothetical protein